MNHDDTINRLRREIDELRKRISELESKIREHAESEEILFKDKEQIERLTATVSDVLYRINMHTGKYEYLSPALERMLGYPLSEPLQHPREFTFRVMHPGDRDRIAKEVQHHLETKKGSSDPLVVECRMVRADGRVIWIRDSMRFEWDEGTLAAANGIMSDITDNKTMEEELRSLSLTDDLTGLYNRRGFYTLGEQHIKIAHRLGKKATVYFVDFNNLKQINDTHGHHEGDKALFETAYLLKTTFRESDVIARHGGDEFAILAIQTQENCEEFIETRLMKNIDDFNKRKMYPFQISVSIGCSYYDPVSPSPLDELLILADRMMYQNKKTNNNSS